MALSQWGGRHIKWRTGEIAKAIFGEWQSGGRKGRRKAGRGGGSDKPAYPRSRLPGGISAACAASGKQRAAIARWRHRASQRGVGISISRIKRATRRWRALSGIRRTATRHRLREKKDNKSSSASKSSRAGGGGVSVVLNSAAALVARRVNVEKPWARGGRVWLASRRKGDKDKLRYGDINILYRWHNRGRRRAGASGTARSC